MKQFSPLYVLLLLALSLCGSCTTEAERRQMEQIIAEADSMNRNYVPLTTDSLLLQACRYYDRHGQPNERMRAHYLLGCAYRDMGEAPRAIDAYQEAVACADTLAEDCDFQKLGCVYSQMADVFHRQLLLTHEIEARKLSYRYGLIAGDTLGAISSTNLMAGTYILLHKVDSAELMSFSAVRQFKEHGFLRFSLDASTTLMYLYAGRPECQSDFRKLICDFDRGYPLFNELHELPSSKRMFYYYKGCYFEGENQLDSAELYYRKMYYHKMPFVMRNSMYKGLLRVFTKRNISDSVAKYAQLYCEANDSSIAVKDQELTARLTASYRYNSIQQEALTHERKANQARIALVVIVTGIVLVTIVVAFCAFQYKKKKEQELNLLKTKYAESVDAFNRNQEALGIINDTRKTTIDRLRQHLTDIEEDLRTENDQLKETIDVLRQQDNIRQTIEKAQEFLANPIIERVKQVANAPQQMLTKTDKKQLLSTTSQYYPKLIGHLNRSGNITSQSVYVCILVGLNLRSAEISNMLGISEQQVSNHKKAINDVLFGENTARTLYKNLVARYGMCAV